MAISNGEGRVGRESRTSQRPEASSPVSTMPPGVASVVTTAALIAGVALVEPELIAGMVIGAGATMLSGFIGGTLRSVLKTGVKAAYTAAEVVAQAAEEVQDLVAEARAEHEQGARREGPRDSLTSA